MVVLFCIFLLNYLIIMSFSLAHLFLWIGIRDVIKKQLHDDSHFKNNSFHIAAYMVMGNK